MSDCPVSPVVSRNTTSPLRLPGKKASQKQLSFLWRLSQTGYLDIVETIRRWWGCRFGDLSAREASMLIEEQLYMTALADRYDPDAEAFDPPTDPSGAVNYQAYLNSAVWAARRLRFLQLAGNRCSKCGKSTDLQVHHRTYDDLGFEEPGDVEVVCKRCHKGADRIRKTSHYPARVEGYARKVYGDNPASWPADIEDEWKRRYGEGY